MKKYLWYLTPHIPVLLKKQLDEIDEKIWAISKI